MAELVDARLKLVFQTECGFDSHQVLPNAEMVNPKRVPKELAFILDNVKDFLMNFAQHHRMLRFPSTKLFEDFI